MRGFRKIVFTAIVISFGTFIGWMFWSQEIKYSLPTPVPEHFVDVHMGTKVMLPGELNTAHSITLLHFFNPECPCSRFNMQEFEALAHAYKNDIQVYVILQADEEDAVGEFQEKYALTLPVVLDRDGLISDRCGIYATPQAVLLDKNSTIYFKGNYNASRYCTRKETRFVQIAIDSLLAGKPLPLAVTNAITEPYGCNLPSDEDNRSATLNFNLF